VRAQPPTAAIFARIALVSILARAFARAQHGWSHDQAMDYVFQSSPALSRGRNFIAATK
jgi:hypothetical protein